MKFADVADRNITVVQNLLKISWRMHNEVCIPGIWDIQMHELFEYSYITTW